jgi:LysR family glycine cleavage system transcriptional activator
MDWSGLPPLAALRAFSAYAQTGSVSAAGRALNVSHAAVSQQMRALETHMGVALLDRRGRSMTLTPDGQALAFTLQGAFESIAETVDALRGAEDDRPLQIACTPSFASMWLMPRLPRFRERHPDIDMMINPTPHITDPARGGLDVALRFGTGPWPGFDCRPLMPAPLLLVGAPRLFPDGLPRRPEDLLRYPWLQELGTNETSRWLESRGVTATRASAIIHLPGNLLLDGLRSGQGVAVATRLAVEADLESGRLVALFEDEAETYYHVVTRPGPARPALRAFLRWLRREARNVE